MSTATSGDYRRHSRTIQEPLGRIDHATRLWEVTRPSTDEAELPEQVRELSYSIYLDLLRDSSFKTWNCFERFTRALANHIRFMELGREDDLVDAEAGYIEALAMEDRNEIVCVNLAILTYMKLESAESNGRAIDLFRVALNSPDPKLRARASAGMANAIITRKSRFGAGSLGDLGEALSLAQEAFDLDPNCDVSAKALAYAHHAMSGLLSDDIPGSTALTERRHHRDSAIRYYRKSLSLSPTQFIAANNLSNLYLAWALEEPGPERDRWLDRAEEFANQALQINPSFALAHDNLGEVRLRRHDITGAQRAFLAALRVRPNYPEAMNDLARSYVGDDWTDSRLDDAVEQHLNALSATSQSAVRAKT